MTFRRGGDQTQRQSSWPGVLLNGTERKEGEGKRADQGSRSGAGGAHLGQGLWREGSLSKNQGISS